MAGTKKGASDEFYNEQETGLRVEAALRGAFSIRPTPMKDIPRKRPKTKRKPHKKSTASA